MSVLVLTKNHRLHVLPCTSILNPCNWKARYSAERDDISHSSHSWPLTLCDVLLVNRHPTRPCGSQVADVQFCSYLSRAYCKRNTYETYGQAQHSNVIQQFPAYFGSSI